MQVSTMPSRVTTTGDGKSIIFARFAAELMAEGIDPATVLAVENFRRAGLDPVVLESDPVKPE